MTIDEYLARLERRLPRRRRSRVLAEAEDHLREAARANRDRGLDADAAERAAVESFGDPDLIARRVAGAFADSSIRWASLFVLGVVLALVLPLYGIPENTLPPATWESEPASLSTLKAVAIVLWLAAIAFALLAVGLSLSSRVRYAPLAVAGTAALVAVFLVVGVVLSVLWLREQPSTPAWPFFGLALPATVVGLAACAAAAARARSLGRDLARD